VTRDVGKLKKLLLPGFRIVVKCFCGFCVVDYVVAVAAGVYCYVDVVNLLWSFILLSPSLLSLL